MRQKDSEFGAAGAARSEQDNLRAKLRSAGNSPVNAEFAVTPSRRATSAITNPATDPTPLTVRGGWMGGGGSGRVVNPMASTEPEGRRIDDSIRNELASLNSGQTQGPRTPGIRQKIMNSIKRSPNNFVAAPRRQRYGAAAGAAALGLTGLSSLIGDESERREQGGQY